MTHRLSAATLTHARADVARPDYDRADMKCGVVHLGIGAFHRAHQAVAFDDCLAAGDMRWGIIGVSLRSAAVRDVLTPQDGLYSVAVRDGDSEHLRVIGAVRNVLVAPEEPQAVVAALASSDTHLVTLTVTEKGYKLDPATGALLTDDVDIAADLADLARPRTMPGFIVAGLKRRREAGRDAFTAISCDNLPHNGARLRDAVLTMARAHGPDLAEWIAEHGAFPQTMVDRIVPATDVVDLIRTEELLGLRDQGAVKTEPFFQWVIEDRFAGPRPAFTAPKVTITPDVDPWEKAKLRLLNGAHSGMAYLGGLAGIEFIDDFVALGEGTAFVEALWDEAVTTLTPPTGLDLAAYRAALMVRFANPALRHRIRQIAADGSQKLPQRLLAPIAERLAVGQSADTLMLAVAAWMCWVSGAGSTDGGVLDDPQAATIAAALKNADTSAGRVDALLALDSVFSAGLAANARFRSLVQVLVEALEQRGATSVLRDFRPKL